MLRRRALRFLPACVSLVLLSLASLSAQTPTATISGRVVDTSGLPIPGVTVTVSSPNLQGVRTTVTSANGDYIFPSLPPGQYTITSALTGFATAKEVRDLAAGQPLVADVTLRPASLSEAVTVAARTDAFANTVEASTNLKQELLAELPTTRTLLAAVNLAPAAHATGPSNAVSISGAMSFENIFLLNGVQIQDNLRGTPLNLFIEDAIQETTISTSGISAEYGRFTGGVVNAVTKSGGNDFHGSLRTTFTNDDWRTRSPFDEPKTSDVVPIYEFTGGGPILRDRTWFFGAGRLFDAVKAAQTGFTNLAYDAEAEEKRFEGKITQSLGRGHNVSASYTDIRRTEGNNAFPAPEDVMDLASLYTRELPQKLAAVHYTGTLRSNLFVEGQYSARRFTFEHDGGTSTDLIRGTVLQDQRTGARWWAPTFCGVCSPEKRDNNDIRLKGNYFWSTSRGAHNMAFGYDTFNDQRRGDNHQSGSDYHVWATTSLIQDDVVYPVIRPDQSTWIIWWPIRESSKGTDFRTHSLFFNDTWAYGKHLTFNLGLRWDKNHGEDAVGQLVARDGAVSPRLGLVWDPSGAGRWSVNASYGKYVAAINNAIADSSSPGGTPSIIAFYYQGPSINATTGGSLVPTDVALQRVFDWFNTNGGTNRDPFFVSIPGVGTQIRQSLNSPRANEYAAGVSRQLGSRGAIRTDVVFRDFKDFYDQRVDLSTGQVTDEFGQEFDLNLIENTNELKRRYAAVSAQVTYRFGSRTTLGGNYTLSRLWGNINGENIGAGPITGGILSYPEYFDRAWSFPEGDLAADQRHRVRLWGNVELPISSRFGRASVGAIQQVQSGTPYGASAGIHAADYVTNPGYSTPLDPVAYFFTDRDAFRTETMYRTDLAVNYGFRLPGAARTELFAQIQLLNVFNNFQLFNIGTGAINTTVLTAADEPDRFQAFDPFSQRPVQGVNWDYGDKFGQATGAAAYTLPRTFQFALGVRF
jgi:outer membrane receptor protein involved in Fe transport